MNIMHVFTEENCTDILRQSDLPRVIHTKSSVDVLFGMPICDNWYELNDRIHFVRH